MTRFNLTEYFSDSDQKSMRRLLAFEFAQLLVFIAVLSCIKIRFIDSDACMFVLQILAGLIGGLLGLTTINKLPNLAEFLKFRHRPVPSPAPNPVPQPGPKQDPEKKDEELKEIELPEPVDETEKKPVPSPAPVELKMRTKQELFVKTFYPHAVESQMTTGINAIAILAQAALESGWKLNPPGNMLFGIKAKATDPADKRQLILTTEILQGKGHKFPEVVSITPTGKRGQYKYRVKDWFRKYATPADSFTDHAQFFIKNKRYAKALVVRADCDKFIDAIAAAGYATDPGYAGKLKRIARQVEGLITRV